MTTTYSFEQATGVMRRETGIVIPVYMPPGVDAGAGEALLRDTVAIYCRQVADPAVICLCVDGEACGADVVSRIADEYPISTSIVPENRGKLFAIRNGVRTLFDQRYFTYIALVDQDGDHFGNELLNFIRVARHIAGRIGSDQVLILGQRRSLHRPMGFLRGEMEELADRVLLDALHYHAAVTGRPLRLEYALAMDEAPDFHSGYKLVDRTTADAVFLGEPQLAGVDEACYYRHGVESVITVETLEAGAYLGTVTRSTINEQPISTFGLYNRIQLVADKMIWPCRRLGIPPRFVRQWLANHIPRLLLSTMAPEGRHELEQIRQAVMKGVGEEQGGDEDEPLLQPLFV